MGASTHLGNLEHDWLFTHLRFGGGAATGTQALMLNGYNGTSYPPTPAPLVVRVRIGVAEMLSNSWSFSTLSVKPSMT